MENNRLQIFGENLERVRKEKGYSRKELADVLGMNPIAYSAYERALRQPSLDKIFVLADFLKVPLTDLTGDASTQTDEKRYFKKEFFRTMKLANLAGCQLDPTPDGGISLTLIKDLIWKGNTAAGFLLTLKIQSDKDFVQIINYIEETAIANNQTFDFVLRQFIHDADSKCQKQDAIQIKVELPAEDSETKEECIREIKNRMATFKGDSK